MKQYLRRIVIIVLVIGAVTVAINVYGVVTAPYKISDDLKSKIDENVNKKINIRVKFKFQPEQFHINMLQKYGTPSIENNDIIISNVKLEDVKKIAQYYYWVRSIEVEKLGNN